MYIKTYASKYLPNFEGTATPSFSMARFSPVSLSPAIGAATPGMVCRNCWKDKSGEFPGACGERRTGDRSGLPRGAFAVLRGPQTHMLTHTRKRGGGNNGHRSVGEYGPPDGKGHKRARTQETLSSHSGGKDEVGGSNPPSSSKILENFGFRGFFVAESCFAVWLKNSDPHRDPHAETAGKDKRAPDGKICFPARFCCCLLGYITCPRTVPMVWAASSCFCRVAWV